MHDSTLCFICKFIYFFLLEEESVVSLDTMAVILFLYCNGIQVLFSWVKKTLNGVLTCLDHSVSCVEVMTLNPM